MSRTTAAPAAPSDPVATARQEAADAESLVAALEERVRTGDDDVTPEQIASARELGRFAKLRIEAANRKAEQARAEQLAKYQAEALAKIRAEAAEGHNAAPEVIAAYDAFETALKTLCEVTAGHNERLERWSRLMADAGIRSQAGQPHPDGFAYVRHDRTDVLASLKACGRAYTPLSAGQLVGPTLFRVMNGYPVDFIKYPYNQPIVTLDLTGNSGFDPGASRTYWPIDLRDMIRKAA